DPEVTLEEDLARRDFTVNAIAQDADGNLIDPFGGVRDIEARMLRHVSPAFVEDPVRVLRAARFMARFAPMGFVVDAQTRELMRAMVADGEVDHLVPERVWQELARALAEPQPSAFLATLRECGALARILPEVDALYGVPQRAEFHPEIDTGMHQQMVSDMAARLAPGDALVGFAALTHDLGKALTPADVLPKHIGHEHAGLAPLAALCERLKVPSTHRELAIAVCREHLNVHRIDELRDATVHDLIARCDGFRKPDLVDRLATVCEADKRGRLGLQDSAYPQAASLRAWHRAALAVDARAIVAAGATGAEVGVRLREARIAAIGMARKGA
ncbi:MAG TPA: multifunctional CCA addition/repair protein, partial [Xanthomonadaceae bacterium]|nr:multifunctional CCA addition/repair protein [Xanthomonadaceae bacterium]